MKIDLGSFAFGSTVTSGGNTPSWGTSLGQIKPDLKLTYPGYDNIVIGMVYKSIPVDKVFIPLGKGGRVYNSLEDEGIQLAAMFDKVYVNEIRVNAPFIMLIYKEDSDSWRGRKTLKYNTKIEYHRNDNDIVYNSDFVKAACDALQIANDACWVVSDMFVKNQDELHMIAGIVNPNQSVSYPNAELRKVAFLEAIKTTYENSSHFKELSGLDTNSEIPYIAFQQIFYGAPGTGKSHKIKKYTTKEMVVRTTFHPDSDYSTFVGAYKPVMDDVDNKVIPVVVGESGTVFNKNEGTFKEKRIIYKFVMQAFTKAYLNAWKKYVANPLSPQPQFLVIEEINRGNCAQIFGDLFQLLDRSDNGFSCYPIEADSDLRLAISDAFREIEDYKLDGDIDVEGVVEDYVSNYDSTLSNDIQEGRILLLPKNLYIWATMNTSDQSLFPIDSAFKRRWDWQYMKITEGRDEKTEQPLGWKILVCDKEEDRVRLYDWWRFLQLINKKIFDATQSADKQMGYFFAKANEVFNGEKVGKIIKGGDFESLPSESIRMNFISAEIFVNKVLFYLWTDVLKDNEYDEIASLMKDGVTDLSFPDFFDESGEDISPVAVRAFLDNVMKEEDVYCDVAEWKVDIKAPNSTGSSFKPKSVIFKITENIQDAKSLYERAKGWWRMAEKRANVNETEYVYVYSTPLKKITACYKITEWNKNNDRFGFEGTAEDKDTMIGQPVESIAHVRGQVVFYPK